MFFIYCTNQLGIYNNFIDISTFGFFIIISITFYSKVILKLGIKEIFSKLKPILLTLLFILILFLYVFLFNKMGIYDDNIIIFSFILLIIFCIYLYMKLLLKIKSKESYIKFIFIILSTFLIIAIPLSFTYLLEKIGINNQIISLLL